MPPKGWRKPGADDDLDVLLQADPEEADLPPEPEPAPLRERMPAPQAGPPPVAPQVAPTVAFSAPKPPPAVVVTEVAACQFRVQFIDNGRPQDIGNVGVNATVADIAAIGKRPGTYYLYPLDMAYKVLRDEPYVLDIGPQHPAFSPAGGSGAAVFGGVAAVPPEVWTLLQQQAATAERQIEILRQELEASRQATMRMQEEVAKERMAIAMRNADGVTELQSKVLDDGMKRAESGQATLIVMMETMRDAERVRAEAERQRLLEAQKAAAQQHEQDLERTRQSYDRERMAEDARRERERDAEERRRQREREDEASREERRAELAREEREASQRAFELQLEAMKAQQKASDPFTGLERLLASGSNLKETLSGLGLDISKLLGGGGGGGLLDVGADLAKTFIQSMVEMKKLEAGEIVEDDGPEEADSAPAYVAQLPDGRQVTITAEQKAQIDAARAQIAPPVAPAPVVAEPSTPLPGLSSAPTNGGGTPVNGSAVGAIGAVDPRRKAAALLPVEVQRKGRAAVRQVVAQLGSLPDDQWTATIVAALDADVVSFLSARAIGPALHEAGAPPAMINKILAGLGTIAPEIPRQ